MNNYDHIKSLSPKEMAWFLMAYSDPCRTCAYKSWDYINDSHKERDLKSIRCTKPEEDGTCIEGTEDWLNRETMKDDDDMFVFTACKRNVEITRRNAIIEAESKKRQEDQRETWEKNDED